MFVVVIVSVESTASILMLIVLVHSSGGNRVVVVAVVVCGSGGGNVRGSKVTAGRQTSWDLGLSHACAMKKHEANQYLLDRARVRMCFVDFWTRINFVCE